MEYDEEEYFDRWVTIFSAMACELKDTSPEGRYYLTITLIVLNIIISLFSFGIVWNYIEGIKILPFPMNILSDPRSIGAVLLAMFIHSDPIHLFGNMFFLFLVGDNIEITMGKLRYLIIYFTAGIYGAYIQSLFTLTYDLSHTHVVMVGASAAISGLIGSYLLLYPGSSMCYCFCLRLICRCFKIVAATYLGLWFTFQFVYMFISPYVAIWAHIGGFLIGIVLTYLLAPRRRINELRVKMFIHKRYRGLKPVSEELRIHSLYPAVRAVIILVSILLVAISALSIQQALELDNKYYTIHVIERVEKVVYYSYFSQYNPQYYHETINNEIVKIFYKINETPPTFTTRILRTLVITNTIPSLQDAL